MSRIRELRMKQGMSQQDLAEAAGVTQPAISDLETSAPTIGSVRVSRYRTLERVARVLGVEVEELLEDALARPAV